VNTYSTCRVQTRALEPLQVDRQLTIWLYLDAEVLVLPPVFYPQDSCFVGRRLFVVNQLPPTRSQFRLLCWCGPSMRGVSVIPRAVSLRVSASQSTGILGIPLPALLSNTDPLRAKTHRRRPIRSGIRPFPCRAPRRRRGRSTSRCACSGGTRRGGCSSRRGRVGSCGT